MKLKLIFLICLCCFAYLGIAQGKLSRGRQIALVIGVSKYEHANPLKNTINDANDLEFKLKKLDFEVLKVLDPDIKSITQKIDSIGTTLTNNDTFLFYFSGHGAEYNGDNYLFLKNSNPTIPSDMPYETYPVNRLIGKIEYSKVKTTILILDACRSNPFVKGWSKSGIVHEGLANLSTPNGTFIGYAASPGKTASDGVRRNGTYTEAILKYIELKNVSIDQIFNKVNKEVRTQTNGKQIPFKSSSLEDDYFFGNKLSNEKTAEKNPILSTDEFSLAKVNRPVFPMPKSIKGYRNEMFNSFGVVSINKTSFEKKDVINLSPGVFSSLIWDKATPIYVRIVKRGKPNSYMMYDEQFQAAGNNVTIKISSSIEKGDYELEIGVYLLNEMNQDYPPFYSKKFNIAIL